MCPLLTAMLCFLLKTDFFRVKNGKKIYQITKLLILQTIMDTFMEELKALLKMRGDDKFFIYKLLCCNLWRLLGEGINHFKAELNYEQNTRLVQDISKKYVIKVIERKCYSNDGDLCITFVA